ncbi:MAG: hypothetical protein HYS41_03665 [Candidatus Omnitrophica bacterium]|nr:hypothetical protein [Candidatus Omnitrophota bacterium]
MKIKKAHGGLLYPYLAVTAGLAFGVATGSIRAASLNFWLTAAAAFTLVTVFDSLVLSMVDHSHITPTQLLFRTMLLVMLVQLAFASIYHFAQDETAFLAREGERVTDFNDALYFSGVTLMTVGYGDIVPRGDFRFTAMAEVYSGVLFIFAFFTWALSVMANRRRPAP